MEVAMFDELSSEDEKKKWLFKENIRLQELIRFTLTENSLSSSILICSRCSVMRVVSCL